MTAITATIAVTVAAAAHDNKVAGLRLFFVALRLNAVSSNGLPWVAVGLST